MKRYREALEQILGTADIGAARAIAAEALRSRRKPPGVNYCIACNVVRVRGRRKCEACVALDRHHRHEVWLERRMRVIKLRYIDGKKYREIADIVGLSLERARGLVISGIFYLEGIEARHHWSGSDNPPLTNEQEKLLLAVRALEACDHVVEDIDAHGAG